MTASTIKFQKRRTLDQRIDRLLDFVPEIRITKLEHGSVKVNDIFINNHYGAWLCKDESFYRRKSRVVSSPAQCFAAPDLKKRIKMKLTRARLGSRMARKAKKTKRINPASKRVAALNKASR